MKSGSHRMSPGFRLLLEYVLLPALLLGTGLALWVNYPDDDAHPPTQPTAGSRIKTGEVGVAGLAPELEDGLRQALGLSYRAPLKLSAVYGIKNLDLSFSGVTSIAGIGVCRNVESLSLSTGPLDCAVGFASNAVQDLRPLSRQTSLRKLDLSCNPVSDISPLKGCTGLQELNLFGTGVIDLSALAAMPELRALNVANCGAIDLSTLPPLPALRHLTLTTTASMPTDLPSRFPALTGLRVDAEWGYHPEAAFNPATLAFPGLRELACVEVQLPPLEQLPISQLERLELSWCKLDTLCDFPAAPYLRTLVLRYNRINDLEPLRGLQRLEDLDLTGCYQVKSFDALADMPRLKKLSVLYTGVTHESQLPPHKYEELKIWNG